MDEDEVREHAERLIYVHNDSYEFSNVYEDEDLEDASEEDWRRIFHKMHEAKIEITWEG